MSSPHVLVVHASAELYGSDRALLACMDVLLSMGAAVTVALPTDGPLVAELANRGARVCVLDAARVLKVRREHRGLAAIVALSRSLPASLAALDGCAEGRPVDLVISHTLAVWGGAAWAARRRLRHWWLVHEIVDRPLVLGRAMAWASGRLSDCVVCNSDATRAWWRGPWAVAPSTRLWNAVDAPTLPPATGCWRPPGCRLVIGVVGRLHPGKGQQVLLEAAEALWQRGRRDIALAFVGDAAPGDARTAAGLRARVAASPLAGQVAMPGFMADRAALYADLDVVCVPSLRPESFGLVAAEAMALGRPVLAARIGALPEVLGQQAAEALHEPGDAAGLAATIERLLDQPAWRARLVRSGQDRWRGCFAPRHHAQGLRTLLRSEPAFSRLERPC